MPYNPKYTTLNSIQLKLAHRLNINPTNTPVPEDEFFPGINTRPAQNIVDKDLLELILEEKESFLDMILSQAYELPLKNQHPILREIIDNWVIAELMKIHFQGVGLANVSGDIQNTANDLIARGNYLVATLMVGRNIFLPIPMPSDSDFNPPIPFILPGETQVPPETLVKKESIIMGMKTRNSSKEHMNIEWGYEAPNLSENRAKGANYAR